jgi:hypothetical protein
MDLSGVKLDKEEDIVGHQSTPRPDLGGEKVGGHQHVHVRADKFLPRSRLLARWRWWDAMPLENVPHGLVADGIPKMGQGADDTVIAPRAVLLGHAYHEGLQLLVNLRAAWSLALLGAIEFLSDELAVPGKNGLGCNDRRHLLQRLLAQLLANLGQAPSLRISQLDTTSELLAQDTVFRHQVFVVQQEFLMH